jgi:mono/diheme cytochrome c family protein
MRLRLGHTLRSLETTSRHVPLTHRSVLNSAARFLAPLAVIAALSIAGGSAAGQSAADSPRTDAASPGAAQNGRKLFVKYACFGCHGREAQGGGLNGPRIAPEPIPFAALLAFVRHPTGEMPPYTSKILPEKDLADIYAFLASQPQPPPVSSIPILKH